MNAHTSQQVCRTRRVPHERALAALRAAAIDFQARHWYSEAPSRALVAAHIAVGQPCKLPQPLPGSLQVFAQRRQLALLRLAPNDLRGSGGRQQPRQKRVHEESAGWRAGCKRGRQRRLLPRSCSGAAQPPCCFCTLPQVPPCWPSAAPPARKCPSDRGPPCRGWRAPPQAPRCHSGGGRTASGFPTCRVHMQPGRRSRSG